MKQVKDSRDVWTHGEGEQLRDLVRSSLVTLLLVPNSDRAAYFSSPWMSDFVLFENEFQQFGYLFPDVADNSSIYFSDYLRELSKSMQVRLITTRSDTSLAFLDKFSHDLSGFGVRFAPESYHEKGILAPSFYIEGSMNITYSGLYVRGEKITYHVGATKGGTEKIATAYLEFDRRWELLKENV